MTSQEKADNAIRLIRIRQAIDNLVNPEAIASAKRNLAWELARQGKVS